MLLQAFVLKVEVKKNPGFDEYSGLPHPSYFLEATVVDMKTKTKYQCSIRDSWEADLLRQAYREKRSEEYCDNLAKDVEAKAKSQLESKEVALVVEDIRSNKDFVTLIVNRE